MDLPSADPQLPPRLDPSLSPVAFSLLTLAAAPWTFETMRSYWGVSTDVADQREAALIESGIIALLPDGRYRMPDAVREMLLLRLINAGDIERARLLLHHWRSQAVESGDMEMMALVHEHQANLLMLSGRESGAIAELRCALALRQAAGDLVGVARISWSLGAFYARRGDRPRAIPLLLRATALAEKLDLEQAPRYRAFLRRIQSSQTVSRFRGDAL